MIPTFATRWLSVAVSDVGIALLLRYAPRGGPLLRFFRASDADDGYGTLVVNAESICRGRHARTARCLMKRAPLVAQFYADGTFVAVARKGRAECRMGGTVTASSELVGAYECVTPRAYDRGAFVLR